MTRREFVIAASTAVTAATASAQSPGRPNVLMIGVDDMNDWVGCLGGYPGVRTPNIDRLAQSGLLLSNAHCPAPVSNPSPTPVLIALPQFTPQIYVNQPYRR